MLKSFMQDRTVWVSRLGCIALCVAGLVAGSCGSEPMGNSPEERAARFKPANDAYTALGYRHVWTGFPRMAPDSHVVFLDVFGDIVVVQESTSTVSVLEASSGINRWADQLANPLTKFVGTVRDDKHLIVSSESEAFFLDVDTGTLVGKQHLDKVANTRPVQRGNLLIYGTSGGEIYAQLKLQGFRIWGNSMPGSIEVEPAEVGSALGFVSQTGDILFLDPASGTGFSRAKIFLGTRVRPAASNDLLFVASDDHSLYAFAPGQHDPVWRHRTDVALRERPVYHEGVVYCSIEGQGLTAFREYGEGGRGKIVWTSKGVDGYVVGKRKGRLLVWNRHDVVSLDPATGDLIDRVQVPNVDFLVTDKFVDGNMYAANKDGTVFKLVPRN